MKKISRRDFVKTSGAVTLAAGALTLGAGALTACRNSSTPNIGSPAAADDGSPAEMPLRDNPNTGDKVSLLGYGCMRWPMTVDKDGNDIVDQEKVNELIDYAIAHGVNYFDAAPTYLRGMCETATAIALSRYPRDSYYIATKLSNHHSSVKSFEDGVGMYRRSFEVYNTDHIDYYLLHSVSDLAAFKERFLDNGLMDFLLAERKAGRIRNLGISTHGNKKGFDELMELHSQYHWDFVQIQLNYVDWTHAGCPASYMYDKLVEMGIPVVVMEPLRGGRLSDVPDAMVEKFKEREPARTIASWAFRFVGTMPGVLTALSGMTYMEHLQDNVSTFEHFKPLTDEELAFLEEMAQMISDYPLVGCTGCQYCMPCPYGINIPAIFKHYNDSVNQGNIATGTEQAEFKKLKRAYMKSYTKAVEAERQADHCISCGQCVDRCPQHIRIPRELRRIDRYVEKLKQEKF